MGTKEEFDALFEDEKPEDEQPAAEAVEAEPEGEEGEATAEVEEAAPEAAEAEEGASEETAEEPKKEPQQRGARIPLAEHLAEREKRQEAERRAQEIEREREAERRRIQELERQIAELQKPKDEPQRDPYEDLPGYIGTIEQKLERQRQQDRLDFSFRLAKREHGELFDEAFQALEEHGRSGNRALVNEIVNSPDAGEAVVAWYRREKTLQEVGTDPEAYRNKLREDLMKDPEFRKQILDAMKAEASTPPAGSTRPATATHLPPSLNKATSAASNEAADASPMSGAEMFRDAIGGR